MAGGSDIDAEVREVCPREFGRQSMREFAGCISSYETEKPTSSAPAGTWRMMLSIWV